MEVASTGREMKQDLKKDVESQEGEKLEHSSTNKVKWGGRKEEEIVRMRFLNRQEGMGRCTPEVGLREEFRPIIHRNKGKTDRLQSIQTQRKMYGSSPLIALFLSH